MESRDVRSEIADPRCTKRYTIILIFTTDIPSVSRRIFFSIVCFVKNNYIDLRPHITTCQINGAYGMVSLPTNAVILGCQMRT